MKDTHNATMKPTPPRHAVSHPSSPNPKRTWWRLAAAFASLSLASVSAVAALPARVFAPYIQVDSTTSLTSISSASGIKYFTLAFIIDDGTGHGLWEAGSTVASDSSIAPAIANLRAAGGDVIISFGGAAGNELAIGITSASTLQSVYQGIINKYGVTALDFDIEGTALDNTSANDRRNQALAGLQTANPGLFISYTLPVNPTGLDPNSIALLQNAKSHGVNVACVNIMAMDYGSSTTPSMGQDAIDATNATSSQLSSNGLTTNIGITPLIGKQDTAPEVFTTSDAQTVQNFAVGDSQVNRIAFWEVALDQCGSSCSGTSQTVWQFSHIFEPFSSSGTGTGTFTITASAGTGGSISPSGSVSVTQGANQTFAIAASSGYAISSVTVDGTGVGAVSSYTFSNVQANHTISAAFSAATSSNVAPSGTAYGWSANTSSTANTNRAAQPGLNDNNLTNNVDLDSAGDAIGAWEGAGVVWSSAQTITSAKFINGDITTGGDGYLTANCTLQYSTDGSTWTNTGWTITPSYPNSSSAGGQTYSASGTALSGVLGMRFVGQVRTTDTSYHWIVKEVQFIGSGGSTTTNYTITASAGTGGSISPSGSVSVTQGANQTFAIAASSGYAISSVTVDGTSVGAVSSHTFSNVQANHTISAAFSAVTSTFTITASAGTGGSISPSGSVSVTQGANQTFAIAASSGYAISSVTVDGAGVGAVSSYTFSNVQANHTISAAFSAATSSNVAPSGTAYGWSANTSSTANTNRAAQPGLNDNNLTNNVDLDSAGDAISAWEGAGVVWSSAQTITSAKFINGDITTGGDGFLTANCTLQYSTDGSTWTNTGWTITPSYPNSSSAGGQTYSASGTALSGVLGMRFVGQVRTTDTSYHWIVKEVQFIGSGGSTTTNYTITASAGTGGSISPSGSVSVTQGANQTFAIAASSGYAISGVTVDGAGVGAVSSYTFSNVQANHTISATFSAVTSTFTITASAGTGGSISPSGSVSVTQGANQTFAIAASSGYAISSVTVDGTSVGAVSSYTFSNVQANHTISAAFSAVTSTFTITASAGTGGSISPSGSVSVTQGASQTFAIAASSGYAISSVTVDGAGVGAVSSYTFSNVQANHTISAAFSAATSSNVAPSGTAYGWSANTSSTANTNRAAQPGLNDNNLTNNVDLDSAGDAISAWEGAGVVWSSAQTITSAKFINGDITTGGDGFLTANCTLQYSTDGSTWTNTGWTITPSYPNSSSAGGQTYSASGTALSGVLGMRFVGQVRTTDTSYHWIVKEVQFIGNGGSSGGTAVATPTFSPAGGSYSSAQSVSIVTTTSGASIRYTTDGSTPSETAGTLYAGPINLSATTTLKAIAYESGMTDSGVASATYTIGSGTTNYTPAQILSGVQARMTSSSQVNTLPHINTMTRAMNVNVYQVSTGVFAYTSSMAIDTDGSDPDPDPDHQSTTTWTDDSGAYLGAHHVPYYVLGDDCYDKTSPCPHFYYVEHNITGLQFALIFYNGNCIGAVFGDTQGTDTTSTSSNDSRELGEASVESANLLGIPSSGTTGGVNGGVTVVIFSGSQWVVKGTNTTLQANAQALVQKALNQLGTAWGM